jgi:uncharacterized delta-60 repeat protein
MSNPFCVKKAILIFISGWFYTPGFTQSLIIKTSFGNNGSVITNLGNDGATNNWATAFQADGKILLGGTGLLRIFANGDIDSSFGTNGFANIRGSNSDVGAVAIQADGKILAALNYGSSNGGLECIRFHSNGTIDSTYNGTGRASVSISGMSIYSRRIAIQQDGKLVIAGFTDSVYRNNIFIARLQTNGLPDNSFNSNGKKIIYLTAGNNYASSVAFQSDGKLIVTGSAKNSDTSSSKLFAIRLFPDGASDMSFNNAGIYEYKSPTASGGEYGEIVSVLPDNKILIAGGTNAKLLVTKLQANGVIDNSFNSNGMVITQIGEFNSPSEMHLLTAGKILVTGVTAYYLNPNSYDFAAYQFLDNGTPDVGFNGTGTTYLPMLENEHCGGSVVLNDGKIILTGFRDSLSLIHLARFNPNGSVDNSFGNNGIKYLLAKGTDDEIESLVIQPDGKIVALGHKYNSQIDQRRVAIARYKTNGGLDSSFGTNGIFFHPDISLSPNSIAEQADGKLVVTVSKGDYYPNFLFSSGVFRLNTNGTIDNSFASASGNLFLIDSVLGSSHKTNIVLQPDGKIILAGNHQEQLYEQLVLVRLNSDGAPDISFGINGIQKVLSDTTYNYFGGITLQNDGKIVLAGSKVYQDSLSKFFVFRLLNNGSPDNSFGINGMSTNIFPITFYADLCSVYSQPDGKIVLAGSVYTTGVEAGAAVLARLDATGNFDNSFNNGGIAYYQYPDSTIFDNTANAMVVNSDSSFYITGTISNANNTWDKYIIRVKYNGDQDSSLSSDGTGWYILRRNSQYSSSNDIKISGDGSIITGGYNYNINEHSDFELNAFTKITTGRLYTFNGNGSWTNPGNWSYGMIPPGTLPVGNVILINPSPGGICTLNVNQYISSGSSMTVRTGANLVIQGGLFIFN